MTRRSAFFVSLLMAVAFINICAFLYRRFIPHSLPAASTALLNAQLGIKNDHLTGTIYNGSDWKIVTVVVRLSIYQENQAERDFGWTEESTPCTVSEDKHASDSNAQVRVYSLRTNVATLSAGGFDEKAGLILARSDNWTCQIIGATGLR
jgi:hypothetical protein